MQNGKFVTLSKSKRNKLSIDDLVRYYKSERAFYASNPEADRNYTVKTFWHPLVWIGLVGYHKLLRIFIKTQGTVVKTSKPIIFAATHFGMYDVEVILHALKKHIYILAADEEVMYRTFDGWFFDANGVIYVDPEDKDDRKVAYKTAVQHLEHGQNILWYPEGIWNLSPNYVVLPIHYGIIEAAAKTGAIIVPIGIDQEDRRFSKHFRVNIGNPFMPDRMYDSELTKEDKIELAEQLRSEMAKVKIELWSTASRQSIPEGYWDDFIQKRLAEWPHYNMEIIQRRIFNPKKHANFKDVFSHLGSIPINSRTAFLIKGERP